MFLFRKRPRGKDEPAGADARAEEPSVGPVARDHPEAPARQGPALPPVAPPPPLPQPVPGATPGGPGVETYARCFVCDAPLETGRCPTCKITWVE